MQAQHLVISPESLLSIQLTAVDQIRRGGCLTRRPSIAGYRTVTAAWRATEYAALELILESGLDPADYPELDRRHSMAPHRPWLRPALKLIETERERLLAEPEPDVLAGICLDVIGAAIRQAIDDTGA